MSKELDYIADLERKNRLLGERCNQLLKDKGELTDRVSNQAESLRIIMLEEEKKNKRIEELDMKRRAERKIFQGIVEKKNDLLIKAKEIIRNLVLEVKGYEEINGYDTCEPVKEAEQFLKEIEK